MFSQRKKIIYFAPHQDDELLTMGIDICCNVQQGHEVHVVLCTDGSKSNMRKVIANGKSCSKHHGLHQYELTVEEFIQARDREFMGSCLALGVRPENIHIAKNRDIDGSLNQENAEQIIRHYMAQLGKRALVCTMSYNSGPVQHRDHKTLGQAVHNLLSQGVIDTAKFFVEPYHHHQMEDTSHLTTTPALPPVTEHLQQAIASYSLWKPEDGRYAVGYHSVTTEFNDFLKNPRTYWFQESRSLWKRVFKGF